VDPSLSLAQVIDEKTGSITGGTAGRSLVRCDEYDREACLIDKVLESSIPSCSLIRLNLTEALEG